LKNNQFNLILNDLSFGFSACFVATQLSRNSSEHGKIYVRVHFQRATAAAEASASKQHKKMREMYNEEA
jgi:hypothetical protein